MELNRVQENLIRSIISGKKDYDNYELEKRFSYLGLPVNCSELITAEITVSFIKDNQYQVDEKLDSLRVYVEKYISEKTNSFCCFCNDYCNIQIVFFERIENIEEYLNTLAKNIIDNMNVEIFISVGKEINSINELPTSMAYGHQLLQYKYQYEDDLVVTSDKLKHFYDNEGIKYTDIYDKVINAFLFGDLQKMSAALSELAENVRQKPTPVKYLIRSSMAEIAIRILNLATLAGINVEDILQDKDPYQWIMSQKHTEVIIAWIIDISGKLIDATNSTTYSSEKTSIKRAISYIETNISNSELSLEEISRYLQLSSPYFSSLFKKTIGLGVNDYINNQRILKAKKILVETKLKIKDVAIQTGFNDVGYFTKVFKRKTGLTPNEFRKGY